MLYPSPAAILPAWDNHLLIILFQISYIPSCCGIMKLPNAGKIKTLNVQRDKKVKTFNNIYNMIHIIARAVVYKLIFSCKPRKSGLTDKTSRRR